MACARLYGRKIREFPREYGDSSSLEMSYGWRDQRSWSRALCHSLPTLVNFLEIWGWQRPSIFQNKHDPYDPHGPGSQLLNWWNVQHRLEWDLGGDVPTSPFCFAPTGSPGKAEWPWTQPSAMQWFINRLRMSRFLFNYPFPRSYRHSGMLV